MHNDGRPAFFFSFTSNPSPKKPKSLNLGSDWCWTCSLGSEIWKENEKRKWRSRLDPSTLFISGPTPDLANLPFFRTCQVRGEAQVRWELITMVLRNFTLSPSLPSSDLFLSLSLSFFLFPPLLSCWRRHPPLRTHSDLYSFLKKTRPSGLVLS
jgi:hypothetical protein